VESKNSVKRALLAVVHLPLNTNKGEGAELAEVYRVGAYFPLFVLTDSAGDVITRWTGYTGEDRFLVSLGRGLSDLTTLKQRIADFEKTPTLKACQRLASFHTETGEHLKAIEYYRRATKLADGRGDYSYQLFENFVNGAWKGLIPFDSVMPAADRVLSVGRSNKIDVIKVAQMMTKLTRKLGMTEHLARYVQAGIDVIGVGHLGALSLRDVWPDGVCLVPVFHRGHGVDGDVVAGYSVLAKYIGADRDAEGKNFGCLLKAIFLLDVHRLLPGSVNGSRVTRNMIRDSLPLWCWFTYRRSIKIRLS
jgi:hypothetical protein